VEIAPSFDLLDRLDAAADPANRGSVHHDLCQANFPDEPTVCTCGIPGLLADLRALLPLPPGALQQYRPERTPAAA
jgi:hypothetical protein